MPSSNIETDSATSNETNVTLVNTLSGQYRDIKSINFFISYNELIKFITTYWSSQYRQPSHITLLIGKLPWHTHLTENNYHNVISRYTHDNITIFIFSTDTLFSSLNQIPPSQPTLIKPIESPLIDLDLSQSYTPFHIQSLLTTNLGWISALEIDGVYLNDIILQNQRKHDYLVQSIKIWQLHLENGYISLSEMVERNEMFWNDLMDNKEHLQWEKVYNDVLNGLELYDNHGRLQKLCNVKRLKGLDTSLDHLNVGLRDKFDKITELKQELQEMRTDIESHWEDILKENVDVEVNHTDMDKFKESIEYVKKVTRSLLYSSKNDNNSEHDTESENYSEYEDDSSDDYNSNDDEEDNIPELTEKEKSLLKALQEDQLSNVYSTSMNLYSTALRLMSRFAHFQQQILKELTPKFQSINNAMINLRKYILTNLNHDLKKFQSLELELAHIEDMPIVYGLYIIELWRMMNWCLIMITDYSSFQRAMDSKFEMEDKTRVKWSQLFGSISKIFQRETSIDLLMLTDVSNIQRLMLTPEQADNIHNDIIQSTIKTLKLNCDNLLKFIEYYIMSFNKLTPNKEIIKVLRKRLLEAQINQFENIVLKNQIQEPSESSSESMINKDSDINGSQLIQSYKKRIEKLESLLHETKYFNLKSWPSTIVNNPNQSTISTTLPYQSSLNNADISLNQIENGSNIEMIKLHKIKEVQWNDKIVDLRAKMNSYKESIMTLETILQEKRIQISDLTLENSAYKETLTKLNAELFRLTNSEEELTTMFNENKVKYIDEIQSLIKSNKSHMDTLKIDNEKFHADLQIQIKELQTENDTQRDSLEKERINWEQSKSNYESEIESLKKEIANLKNENNDLKTTQVGPEIVPMEVELTKDNELIKKYQSIIFDIEKKLFNIFKTNVFILENIGLLLTNDASTDSIMEIKRVKGLRKNSSHTVLDESVQKVISLDENKVIQSDIYHRVKDIMDIYFEDSQKDMVQSTEELIRGLNSYLIKLYNDKMYERAVIRRFNDIETLAKKLTKENKCRRNTIEKFKTEKITVKNLQVGDLALFLPTRDHMNLNKDPNLSVSSLTSSFSSVDLSTPPIPTSSTFERLDQTKDTTTKKKSGLLEKCHLNNINCPRVWAAFTAYEDDARYLLKSESDNELLKDKEWFIGKILTIDDIVVSESNMNIYKIPKGLTCYQVTAELLSQEMLGS